jgi:hypothetical protein
MMGDEVLVSDLSRCTPADAVCERMTPGKWWLGSYSTADFSGRLLFAGPHNDAPPVRIHLPVKGWYRIYIGVHYSDTPDSIAVAQSRAADALHMLRLKLGGDPCYHVIFPERYLMGKEGPWPEHRFSSHDLCEVLWRPAELKDGYIEFSPARDEEGYRHTSACVAYIRLAPMTSGEIDEVRRDRARKDTRRLIGMYDGAFWGHWPWTEGQYREFVEPLRESDFRVVAWSTSRADVCQYASKQFQIMDGPATMGVKPYYVARDIRRSIADGLDPLECMVRICHEMGLEFLASMRMSSQHLPPHQTFCPAPYLWSRPENRTVSAEGLFTGHLSLGVPAVRQRLTAVLREQAENYDIDGVHILFNRSYPFVLYEEPVRSEFIAEHGEDPVKLDPREERWIRHKGKYVTEFIRGVREMLDQAGQAKGRRLKLALHVMSCPRHNRFFGLDLDPMIRNGWIDYLLPHPTYAAEIAELEGNEGYGPNNVGHHSVTPERVAEWMGLARGTGCGIYPDILPRRMPADEFRKAAMRHYQAGADGLSFHDLYWRIHRKSEWAMLSKLGHRDELPQWEDRCRDAFRTVPLRTMIGLSMDPKFNPGTNG